MIAADFGPRPRPARPTARCSASSSTCPTGGLVDIWTVSAPTNGSTIVIFAAASDFGLTDGSGPFDYAVDTFSLEGFGDDSTSGVAGFDPFHPALSQGDFIGLDHGDAATLPVSVDLAQFATAPALGWMVVTMDDKQRWRARPIS